MVMDMGKDSLNELFRQRFQGHEHPVDPGVWQAVQDQLISPTAPVEQDGVAELFKDRFQGHEHPVDPALWQQISTQLGHQVAAGAASGGIGSLGWAAAGLTAVLVSGAVYLSYTGTTAEQVAEVPVTSVVVEPLPEPEASVPYVVEAEAQETIEGSATEPAPDQASGPATVKTQAGEEAIPVAPMIQAEPEEQPLTEEPTPRRIQEASTPIHGTQLVENIIQEMTTQVEQEVIAESRKNVPDSAPGNGTSEFTETLEPEVDPFTDLPVLYLPNTFTPNGDGINDTYEVGGKEFGQMLIRVFDVKNNQLVFSTNTNEPWTGANCVDGYYLVAVEAQTLDGRLVTQGKVVWLNRNPLN